MNLGTILYTWLYGRLVGEDKFKNKYYSSSSNFLDLKAKRWVIFKGDIEATKVPPHWHAWLHKSIDKPPLDYKHIYPWQKDHEQNMTGTSEAYYPKSHPLSKSHEDQSSKDTYETWDP
mgnify:FL=1|tara:strand:- start:136 stop:489 length:354 start_codon:yes stop_codon:yes gene_type:complete